MVDREEVEKALAYADSTKANGVCIIKPRTLAALCRAWLALEDAPVVCVGESAVRGDGWQMYGTDGDRVVFLPFDDGQRVRIVPVEGGE